MMGRWSLDPPDYPEPPEEDESWEDDVPDWWWETSYVDAADYDWNEARYVEWCEEVAATS
jgi:hypothetical protein